MDVINAKAALIVADIEAHVQHSSGVSAGPTSPAAGTIMATIIGLITDIIGAFQNCAVTPPAAQAMMTSPDPTAQRVFGRKVRRRVRRAHLVAIENQVQLSTTKVAATLTVPEVQTMYTEVSTNQHLDFMAEDTDVGI